MAKAELTFGISDPVWKSLLHHRELLDHSDFSRVREALSACFSAPPTVSHVYYDEQSRALHHPILHILRAETTLPDDVKCRQHIGEAVKRVVGFIGKTAFGGQSLENPGVYFVFIGGTTVEVGATTPFNDTHPHGLFLYSGIIQKRTVRWPLQS